jgi:hypothetical protein
MSVLSNSSEGLMGTATMSEEPLLVPVVGLKLQAESRLA